MGWFKQRKNLLLNHLLPLACASKQLQWIRSIRCCWSKQITMWQQNLVIPTESFLLSKSPACCPQFCLTISIWNCSPNFNFVSSHLTSLVSSHFRGAVFSSNVSAWCWMCASGIILLCSESFGLHFSSLCLLNFSRCWSSTPTFSEALGVWNLFPCLCNDLCDRVAFLPELHRGLLHVKDFCGRSFTFPRQVSRQIVKLLQNHWQNMLQGF